MTDDELIEKFKRFLFWEGLKGFEGREAGRLIALARFGAAVKPRPISEAPKDGNWLLGWELGQIGEARPLAWNKAKKAWCDLPDGDRFEDFTFTHFIPLSALPPPEQQEPK